MGKEYPALSEVHIEWIGQQHLFFVGTAPLDADGNVNLSPKGYNTFRVISDSRVAYLDLTGSGIETLAHLAERPRITVMFVGFEGRPRILRLYGAARYLPSGSADFAAAIEHFGDAASEFAVAARGIVMVDVDRVRSSCGYSIPYFEYAGERETLADWADNKGREGIEDYWDDRNGESIDGKPGLIRDR